MIRPDRTPRGRAGLALAALAASSSLYAQTAAPPPPPTNAGRELENAKPMPPPPVKPDADALPKTTEPARQAPADTRTMQVNGFQITGNTLFPEDTLQAIVKPFVGRSLNFEQLLDAADDSLGRLQVGGWADRDGMGGRPGWAIGDAKDR